MTDARPTGARQKILAAAEEIAATAGPANLSLDAVAARAGVSKGGLLYHFPSKAKLLEAVVERFMESFEEALAALEKEKNGAPNSLADAYLDLFLRDCQVGKRPPSGLLAALAENPDFLAPVRRFQRAMLNRMKENAVDPTIAVVVFLAIQGFRSLELLNLEIVTEAEIEAATQKMRRLLVE